MAPGGSPESRSLSQRAAGVLVLLVCTLDVCGSVSLCVCVPLCACLGRGKERIKSLMTPILCTHTLFPNILHILKKRDGAAAGVRGAADRGGAALPARVPGAGHCRLHPPSRFYLPWHVSACACVRVGGDQ